MPEENGLVKTEAVPGAIVRRPVSISEAVLAFQEFEECKNKLATPDDIQQAGKGKFYKKRFWRKVAMAYNIQTEQVEMTVQRDDTGFPMFALSRYRATAANGRFADGEHEAHARERCCPSSRGDLCDKESWSAHTCCEFSCDGRGHWSHPGDIVATAATRAMNRAISNLVGGGEPTAEEIPSGPAPAPTPSSTEKSSGSSPAKGKGRGRPKTFKPPSEKQVAKFLRPIFSEKRPWFLKEYNDSYPTEPTTDAQVKEWSVSVCDSFLEAALEPGATTEHTDWKAFREIGDALKEENFAILVPHFHAFLKANLVNAAKASPASAPGGPADAPPLSAYEDENV